ncbi:MULTISPECIES: phosphate ABC transporter permease PstA [Aerococcus]|uniref:Phosphate transport system permease protein PstA n=1 Tax=Aerococcus sanguinicola TaxID=119206 RepID=A0A5N1GPX9_9LACT|nr:MULTISPECIES: phosphate ABC transporter permease PstA [Aerococcus]KAA9302278.1 phosphate ABC transporter permease PstA [Aerococcus sanguinicola]MDK6369032.1 phosphate ABC transporter permease PstA [Aerococcus sp. UMB9870]MDK6678934.1 phosphate ABC transporter permease PstA [Aerococcus sp. UMB8608]MDK6686525.1 phosphate ABC transporter permease PstA [Aerococcus sp. UMB8623]MDK6939593.1 phosphate ABC transporter permease PstA [Aerococcus sp. UMB8487]
MDKALKYLTYFFTIITFAWLIYIVGYVLINGIPHLSADLFALEYTTDNVSMMPAIITTIYVILGALLISVPLGVFAGFYLIEYAGKNNKWVEAIRVASDTLSGVPSIVYGLFGMLAFVIAAGFQYSLIAGILTMSIMVLPLIIRNTEEGLMSVSDKMREGSYGLGAGKLRTIFRIVLPVAMPGILSGIILAIGRIVGETAALMYTLGSATNLPDSLFASGRTLALHMYILSTEGLHRDQAMATGVVLLLFVLIINGLSTWLSNKLGAQGGQK